jgi:hypothetical protein
VVGDIRELVDTHKYLVDGVLQLMDPFGCPTVELISLLDLLLGLMNLSESEEARDSDADQACHNGQNERGFRPEKRLIAFPKKDEAQAQDYRYHPAQNPPDQEGSVCPLCPIHGPWLLRRHIADLEIG